MSTTLYKIGICLFLVLVPYTLGGALLWAFGAYKRRSFRCVLTVAAIATALGWRLAVNPDSRRYMLSLVIPSILLAAYFCSGLPRIAGRWAKWLRKISVVLSVLIFLPLVVSFWSKNMRFNRYSGWLQIICKAYSESSRNAPDRKIYLLGREIKRYGHYLNGQRPGELLKIPRQFQSEIADYRKKGRDLRVFLADFRHCPYPCYLLMNEVPGCLPLSEVHDMPGLDIRLCVSTLTSRKQDNLMRLYKVTSREAEMHFIPEAHNPPLVSDTASSVFVPNGSFESWQPDDYAKAIQERMSKQLPSVSVVSVPENWGLRILDSALLFSRPTVLSRETERPISGKSSCRMSADALITLVSSTRLPPGDYRLLFRVSALRDSHFGVRFSYAKPVPERVYLADFRIAGGKCLEISIPIFRGDFRHPMAAYLTFDLMSGEILLDDVVVSPSVARPVHDGAVEKTSPAPGA